MGEGRAAARRQEHSRENHMRKTNPLLIGVAHGHGDQWEAFCLDFDLAVAGTSFEEVQASLTQAVRMYLETAFAEPEPIRSKLLGRRAPFLVRLTLGWRLFRATLAGHTGRRERAPDTFEFVACHAKSVPIGKSSPSSSRTSSGWSAKRAVTGSTGTPRGTSSRWHRMVAWAMRSVPVHSNR
jgi:hypothetical protein